MEQSELDLRREIHDKLESYRLKHGLDEDGLFGLLRQVTGKSLKQVKRWYDQEATPYKKNLKAIYNLLSTPPNTINQLQSTSGQSPPGAQPQNTAVTQESFNALLKRLDNTENLLQLLIKVMRTESEKKRRVRRLRDRGTGTHGD